MNKRLLLFCAALLLASAPHVSAAAAADYEVKELTGTATITAESLNVRSGPSKNYDAIGKARDGETYPVTGQADTGWYRIEYNGTQGYVADQYVTVEFNSDSPSGGEDQNEDGAEGPGQGNLSLFDMAGGNILITGAVIAVVIIILLVCIGITVKKMLSGEDEEDLYDEEEEDDISEEQEDDMICENTAGYDAPDYAVEETGMPPAATAAGQRRKTRAGSPPAEEEDYRLFIDPRYFEDETPYEEEETPYETAYENESPQENEKTEIELQEAMKKLNELQREIERLKEKNGGR